MREAPRRTVDWTAEQYVLSRHGARLVSTSDAIRAVRAVLLDCALSDRELTDLIARVAIRHGLDISFDGYPSREEMMPSAPPPSI